MNIFCFEFELKSVRKKHANFVFLFYKPVSLAWFHLNPFLVNVAIWYPLETSENQKFFVFSGGNIGLK